MINDKSDVGQITARIGYNFQNEIFLIYSLDILSKNSENFSGFEFLSDFFILENLELNIYQVKYKKIKKKDTVRLREIIEKICKNNSATNTIGNFIVSNESKHHKKFHNFNVFKESSNLKPQLNQTIINFFSLKKDVEPYIVSNLTQALTSMMINNDKIKQNIIKKDYIDFDFSNIHNTDYLINCCYKDRFYNKEKIDTLLKYNLHLYIKLKKSKYETLDELLEEIRES